MSPKINCIIIEDELPAAQLLELHIDRFEVLKLKGKFQSVQTAMSTIKEDNIDLIFLDINLPGKSGIDFASNLPPGISVIFTTAYAEFALQGFELDAVDYLIKPISFERFTRAFEKFLKLKSASGQQLVSQKDATSEPFIYLKSERMSVKVLVDDILYIEAKGNFLVVYTKSENIKTYLSISEIMERLPEGLFCRIHRSFLIALSKVSRYNSHSVNVGQAQLPIGRLYGESVRKAIWVK
jgi:DNA-binding LytR/AlgR family response regulator